MAISQIVKKRYKIKANYLPVLPFPALVPLLKSNHYEQFLIYLSKNEFIFL